MLLLRLAPFCRIGDIYTIFCSNIQSLHNGMHDLGFQNIG